MLGEDPAKIYQSALFVKEGQACRGDQIAALFKELLQRYAPFGALKISQYRHAAIGFMEKHLKNGD